jgi:hypothetical protein
MTELASRFYSPPKQEKKQKNELDDIVKKFLSENKLEEDYDKELSRIGKTYASVRLKDTSGITIRVVEEDSSKIYLASGRIHDKDVERLHAVETRIGDDVYCQRIDNEPYWFLAPKNQ